MVTDDGADSLSVVTSEVSGSNVQGNGGNDTIYFAEGVDASTVKGGDSIDYITAGGAVTGSEVAGNKGADTILDIGGNRS